MTYVDPDLITDETAVAEGNLAALADSIPGWQPSEGHVETSMAEAFGMVEATIAQFVVDTERNAYAAQGELLFGVTRQAATAARSTVTIDLGDPDGHTVPAGFGAVFVTTAGEDVAVTTLADAVAAPGETQVSSVPVVAQAVGADQNGATGADVDRDDLAYVVSVTLEQATSGGGDEEPLTDYVDRVVTAARRRSFLPQTPSDYASSALDVPGVHRAIAINRIDAAGNEATGNLRIVAVDQSGLDVPADVKTAIVDHFAAMDQVLGATVHVGARTVVTVDVAATVRPAAGYTQAEANDAAEAAIRDAWDPATFNADPSAAGGWARGRSTQLTIFDGDQVIRQAPQVGQVVSVTLNGGATPITVGEAALLAVDDVTVTAP